MKYIRHQECEIEINNKKVFAKSAQISAGSSAQGNIEFGGNLRNYNATSALSASASISYYITGKEDHIAELTGINPCSGRFCGIEFSGAYLNNYSIEIEPYKPVQFNADLTIYSGYRFETKTGSFEGSSTGLANGAYTELINFNKNNIGLDYPKNISYNIQCERSANYVIGEEFAQNITLGSVRKNVSVRGENVGSIITFSGRDSATLEMSPRNIDYAARGQTLNCNGVIVNQDLSVSSNNGLLAGTIEILEVVR